MKKTEILMAANYVYNGEKNKKEIVKLTQDKFPDLTVENAYLIQKELIKLREKDGHIVYAPKMGLTSKAKWDQMGVDSPIFGYIFDDMIEQDSHIMIKDYIHPKVEPEIAIVLKKELSGEDVTIDEVIDSIDYVVSCAEIIDSRYLNFDFTLSDVIADNTSASGAFFSKKRTTIEEINLQEEYVTVQVNGVNVADGTGKAVLGHPATSIVELAKLLAKDGKSVPVGVPIMTGGITSAVLLQQGDFIEISYSNLEKISFNVK